MSSIRSVWALVFELTDGEHVIETGPCSEPRARRNFRGWLNRNPEAKADVSKAVPVTPAESEELKQSILTKYPRRKPLESIFNGVPMMALHQPHRVPGSRIAPPQPILGASTWGKLARW